MSVSERRSWPFRSSPERSVAKFSMMPLCTTATPAVLAECGCALTSLGAPWVAQRVWPMPVVESGSGVSSIDFSRLASLPAFLSETIAPSWASAIPAES